MPTTRDLVFDRVLVDHLVRGSTRVSWSLYYVFNEPTPHTFTLQVGATGNPDADDWKDVGGPVVDASYAVDDEQRVFGTNPTTNYRVRLVTPVATHYSKPAAVFGLLSLRDWLYAREIVRKELLLLDVYTAAKGWLLKRKRSGTRPPAGDPRTAVVDPLTGEMIRRNTTTFGTPYEGGYYRAIPFLVALEPGGTYERVDSEQQGNEDPETLRRTGRVVVFPHVAHRDVFVEDGGDLRYYLHVTKYLAHARTVPLVARCELRQAPFTDVVYDAPLD